MTTQPEHQNDPQPIDMPEYGPPVMETHLGLKYAVYTAPDGATAQISEYGLRAAATQPELLAFLQGLGTYARSTQLMSQEGREPEVTAAGLQRSPGLIGHNLHLVPLDPSLELELKQSNEPGSEYHLYGLNRLHHTISQHDQTGEDLVIDTNVIYARFALPNGRSLLVMERAPGVDLKNELFMYGYDYMHDYGLLGELDRRLTTMLSPAELRLLSDITRHDNLIGDIQSDLPYGADARGRVTIIDNPPTLSPQMIARAQQAFDEIEQTT